MDLSPRPRPASGITRTCAIPDFTLTEFTRPPLEHLPWHDHRDASLCFVATGGYAEEMDGHTWDCQADAMVFKPPFEGHEDRFGPLETTCLLIEIAPTRVRAVAEFTDITSRPSVRRSPGLSGLGRRIHAEVLRPDGVTPLALEGLILESLASAVRIDLARCGRGPAWLDRARQLIEDDPYGAHSLSSIATDLGIHPSHLARTFRARYRRSIGEYLRETRIVRAAREISETDTPLAEIAARAGFFDQSHFSRVFRRQTGQTPAAYRRAAGRRNGGTSTHSSS